MRGQWDHIPVSPVVEGFGSCLLDAGIGRQGILLWICEGCDASEGSSLGTCSSSLPLSLPGPLCSGCWLEAINLDRSNGTYL